MTARLQVKVSRSPGRESPFWRFTITDPQPVEYPEERLISLGKRRVGLTGHKDIEPMNSEEGNVDYKTNRFWCVPPYLQVKTISVLIHRPI